jgi:hypothetical protein
VTNPTKAYFFNSWDCANPKECRQYAISKLKNVRADGTIRNVGYVEITKFTVFANNIKEARAIARKKRLLNKKEAA